MERKVAFSVCGSRFLNTVRVGATVTVALWLNRGPPNSSATLPRNVPDGCWAVALIVTDNSNTANIPIFNLIVPINPLSLPSVFRLRLAAHGAVRLDSPVYR